MTVYAVYYASDETQADVFDLALDEQFGDTYRVSDDFWLIDTAHESDTIYGALRDAIRKRDRLFIAEITRDFFPGLSHSALSWLLSPRRSWKGRYVAREVADRIRAAA
ncbi:hypothetical protein [Amorphus sp. 3PC139-8]|uniref:hypothetical protein n=1 Tax=Amorphus sp. 3PC139-8 TaxID=2735676 RepID=UPI00345D3E94